MSKSFTYNLIVTQSKEAIDRLFFDTAVPSNGGLGKTRRDLLQSFEDLGDLADDILISPYNNSDFLSFEKRQWRLDLIIIFLTGLGMILVSGQVLIV